MNNPYNQPGRHFFTDTNAQKEAFVLDRLRIEGGWSTSYGIQLSSGATNAAVQPVINHLVDTGALESKFLGGYWHYRIAEPTVQPDEDEDEDALQSYTVRVSLDLPRWADVVVLAANADEAADMVQDKIDAGDTDGFVFEDGDPREMEINDTFLTDEA